MTDTALQYLSREQQEIMAKSLRSSVEIIAKGREWKPIETAPRDGTEILVFVRTDEHVEMQQVAHWDGAPTAEWPWQVIDGSAYHRNLFTHWQPLPPPPTSADPQ